MPLPFKDNSDHPLVGGLLSDQTERWGPGILDRMLRPGMDLSDLRERVVRLEAAIEKLSTPSLVFIPTPQEVVRYGAGHR